MQDLVDRRSSGFSPARLSEALTFAGQLADEAAALALTQFRTVNSQVKDDGTLVTSTDLALDQLICERIRQRFPDHSILSEEAHTSYRPSEQPTWVIDPLDGTTNFARGLPLWGVSIGLMVQGQPVAGAITFPALHDSYQAALGLGAWCNGRQLFASHESQLDAHHLLFRCTRTDKRFVLKTPLKARVLGSAAYHICKVADGAGFASIETTPKLWDIAAAAIILREAGGDLYQIEQPSANSSGEPIAVHPLFPLPLIEMDYRAVSFPLITTANRPLLTQLTSSIFVR